MNIARVPIPSPSLVLIAVTVAAALLIAPSAARGQTSGEVIHACYIPASGTVYRIKAEGAPDDCRGKHIEFSWDAHGPAGQSCPGGEFVTGFAADGSLLCGAATGDGGGTGGSSPAEPFFGTWDIEPDISVDCGVSYVITGVQISGSDSADLIFAFLNTLDLPAAVAADYDPDTETFQGELIIDPAHLQIDGQFTSLDTFTMQLLFTAEGSPECTIDETLAGTRTG